MRVGLHVGNFELSMKRIRTLFIILLVIFTLFAARLVQIQGIQSAEYTLKAANEMQKTRVIAAPRGDITDINGVAFARSVSQELSATRWCLRVLSQARGIDFLSR